MAERHPPVFVSVLLNARGLAPFYSHLHSISAMVLWLRINNTSGCQALLMLAKLFLWLLIVRLRPESPAAA